MLSSKTHLFGLIQHNRLVPSQFRLCIRQHSRPVGSTLRMESPSHSKISEQVTSALAVAAWATLCRVTAQQSPSIFTAVRLGEHLEPNSTLMGRLRSPVPPT